MTIDWANFTPYASLIGGVLIGVASLILLLWDGRIAGISGIVGGLIQSGKHDFMWRLMFVIGLLVAPWIYALYAPLPVIQIDASPIALIVAGVLVGLGTRLGSGCTSGHGICGLARFSKRSLVAVGCFMATAFITVFVMRHLIG